LQKGKVYFNSIQFQQKIKDHLYGVSDVLKFFKENILIILEIGSNQT